MKMTKRQLRKMIREEKGRLDESRLIASMGFGALHGSNSYRMSRLAEQPISGEQAEQMQLQKDWDSALKYFSDGAGMMSKFSEISDFGQWQGNEANDLAAILEDIWVAAGFDPMEIFK